MSFGFSVGDFLNGATLAYDLIGALSSSCGSSLVYQQLIHELEIVRLTCVEIESLRSSQQLNRSLLNALTHLVRDCNKAMEQCAASVECYRESLQPGGSGSTIADSWKKMGWSLFKPRVIRSMRDRLQLKIACMNLLLSAGGCLGWSVILQNLQSGSRLADTAWVVPRLPKASQLTVQNYLMLPKTTGRTSRFSARLLLLLELKRPDKDMIRCIAFVKNPRSSSALVRSSQLSTLQNTIRR
jgi:hypothetical protein